MTKQKAITYLRAAKGLAQLLVKAMQNYPVQYDESTVLMGVQAALESTFNLEELREKADLSWVELCALQARLSYHYSRGADVE